MLVEPGNESSTHHVGLINKRGEGMGLILVDDRGRRNAVMPRRPHRASNLVVKPQAGRFDNRQEPFVAIEESDWSGGSSQEDFERNRTKFYDSAFMWTLEEGLAYPAPLFHWTTGYRSMNVVMPGDCTIKPLLSSDRYVFASFSPSATYEVDTVGLILEHRGSPGTLTVELRNNATDEPGTVIKTVTYAASDMVEPFLTFEELLDFTASDTVTSGTTYWIGIYSASTDDIDNHWRVGMAWEVPGTTKHSSDGTTWVAAEHGLYYVVGDTEKRGKRWPFEYKRALYKVVSFDDGSAPKLYLNGYRGVVAAGTTTSIQDTSQNWTANALSGGVALITDGTGEGGYSLVTSNTSDTLTVALDKAPASDSEYVVLGLDVWVEIGTTGLTGPITGRPLVSNGLVYFPQGDSVNIRKFRAYNNAGTWTNEFSDDGTNKAVHAILAPQTDGTTHVWVSRNNDANGNTSVSHGAQMAWGTAASDALTLAAGKSPIQTGDNYSLINGMAYYDGTVWPCKEDGLWRIENEIAEEITPEFKYMASRKTGLDMVVQNPNLLLTFGQGLEQWYLRTLADIGPNKGAGLPSHKQGFHESIIPSVRFTYSSINAGHSGYSTVKAYNSAGWGEIYRAPKGESIRQIWYQVIPGLPARLWVFMDRVVGYLEMPEFSNEPEHDSRIDFHYASYLETSWISDNLLDIQKYWAYLNIYSEGLDGEPPRKIVEMDYKVDDDTSWTTFNAWFDTSPSERQPIGNYQVEGYRIKLRLRIYNEDSASIPKVKSLVPEYVAVYPTAYAYTVRFEMSKEEGEKMEDLEGNESEFDADDIRVFLENATNDPVPLLMLSVIPEYDGKRVKVLPQSFDVRDLAIGEARRLIGSMVLMEVA